MVGAGHHVCILRVWWSWLAAQQGNLSCHGNAMLFVYLIFDFWYVAVTNITCNHKCDVL